MKEEKKNLLLKEMDQILKTTIEKGFYDYNEEQLNFVQRLAKDKLIDYNLIRRQWWDKDINTTNPLLRGIERYESTYQGKSVHRKGGIEKEAIRQQTEAKERRRKSRIEKWAKFWNHEYVKSTIKSLIVAIVLTAVSFFTLSYFGFSLK